MRANTSAFHAAGKEVAVFLPFRCPKAEPITSAGFHAQDALAASVRATCRWPYIALLPTLRPF